MIRNLKVLGLALVAMAAMSAVVASGASAKFHTTTHHTILTGSQVGTNTFATTAGTIHCSTATFEGTETLTTSEWATVTPTYSGCQATPFGGATVHVNGCKYEIHTTGSVNLVCPEGKNIVVTAPFCTITIKPQTLNSVSLTNVGSGETREIEVSANVSGIHYVQTAGCTHGSGTFTNGHYTGTVKVTGENTAEEHVAIWHQIE